MSVPPHIAAALPAECAAFDAETIARYARTTSPHATTPLGVLWPETADEVRRAVAACAEAGVPVYPISRGKNWGYGDACAPRDGAVILDLSKMNRILRIDTELGYAEIEPGVSQGELAAAVREQAPDFWLDCSGAGPDASIVGNALERGFGHTPYADHLRTSSIAEAVLADGQVLRPGFHRFEQAKAAALFPYGVGPYLDGLLTQSNLAVVTRMYVWLCPRPESFAFFYVKVDEDSGLEALIDALRPLRLQGVLNSAVHVGSLLRVVSGQNVYPQALAEGRRPLDDQALAKLRSETNLGAWSCSGSLTGTKPQVREARKRLHRAMRRIGRVVALTERELGWARTIADAAAKFGLLKQQRKMLLDLQPHLDLLRGTPTEHPLRGALWGIDTDDDTPRDPLDAEAGLLWLSPVLPLRGADARAVTDLATRHLREHGFDFLATYTLLNERSMVGILNIAFDRRDAEQCARAAACYAAAMTALIDAGYPPYRASPDGMALLRREPTVYDDVTRRIKQALDPGNVLAPGRYIDTDPEGQ